MLVSCMTIGKKSDDAFALRNLFKKNSLVYGYIWDFTCKS